MPPKTTPAAQLSQLDLVIIHDVTGSQGPYIEKTTKRCEEICLFLRRCGKLQPSDGFRVALIAFRDHPPMDNSFVLKDFGGFTYELEEVQQNLRGLKAEGGGDIPEAVTAALYQAVEKLHWRPNAIKVVILITDAPPHGTGDPGDGIPGGDPNGHDPLILARRMGDMGITLFVIACEPTLSGHAYANEFYEALAQLTTGVMFPLTDTNLLASFIIASTLETIDLAKLSVRYEKLVRDRKHAGKRMEDIAEEIYEELKASGETVVGIETDSPYTPLRGKDIQFWKDATNLGYARANISRLTRYDTGGRFTEEYKKRKAGSGAEIKITLMNYGSEPIEYEYYEENGEHIHGKILPEQEQEKRFKSEVPYNFRLSDGNNTRVIGRTFSVRGDLELANYLL